MNTFTSVLAYGFQVAGGLCVLVVLFAWLRTFDDTKPLGRDITMWTDDDSDETESK